MRKKQPSEQTPVYAVVHASLRTQIFTGQYRPGDLLPSESHLCQEFGASRETVRRGLQQLENEGLIFSRPKIGYFVSQPNHNDMVLSLSEELEGTELQYRDIHGILPDERLEIAVKDHGIGIADVAQARTPLYTTGGEERSGMGFTIMESFMTSLQVTSKPGRGTTVHMKRKIVQRGKNA